MENLVEFNKKFVQIVNSFSVLINDKVLNKEANLNHNYVEKKNICDNGALMGLYKNNARYDGEVYIQTTLEYDFNRDKVKIKIEFTDSENQLSNSTLINCRTRDFSKVLEKLNQQQFDF